MQCTNCGKELMGNFIYCPFCGKPTCNDAEQLYSEGISYYNAKNYAEALKWLLKVAELGHSDAQYWLGVMYNNGQGVIQNFVEAAKWYRKAAEQGHRGAQCSLGFMYENGQGVRQDYAEAVKWYWNAAQQGDVNAQCNLGFMYETGQGVVQNYTEAEKWYLKAAEEGLARAQYNLGNMYLWGKGVEQDVYEAVIWFKKAAKQGDEIAQNSLDYVNKNGRYDSYNNEVDIKYSFDFDEPVTVSEVCVKVGDEICKWDILLKWHYDTFSTRYAHCVQSEKVRGVVTNIYVKKGDKIKKGKIVMTVKRCKVNKKQIYYGMVDFYIENHAIRLIKSLFSK